MDEQSTPTPRVKARFLPFCLKMPITKVVKMGEIFAMETVGDILIDGRGRIDPSKTDDLPAEFAANGWLTVELSSVLYNGADLLPLLNSLPAAKPLRDMIEGQAKAQCILIYNAKFTR